jgi:hypothetical protein
MISTGTMVSVATFLYIRQQQEKETLQSVRLSIVLIKWRPYSHLIIPLTRLPTV